MVVTPESLPSLNAEQLRELARDLIPKVARQGQQITQHDQQISELGLQIAGLDQRPSATRIARSCKVVQQAVVTVLYTIYEEDFLGFSYGFRQGRSQHDALDALTVGIKSQNVNWILDADISSFFDEIDHDWMLKFLEHRIADRRPRVRPKAR